jgi:MerR family mercuric resistance operon transcriptional regulator
MGFTLDEITGLLEVRGKRACEQTRKLTEQKLADVRQRLVELRQLEADLASLIVECGRASRDAECPTLTLLGCTELAASQTKRKPRLRKGHE